MTERKICRFPSDNDFWHIWSLINEQIMKIIWSQSYLINDVYLHLQTCSHIIFGILFIQLHSLDLKNYDQYLLVPSRIFTTKIYLWINRGGLCRARKHFPNWRNGQYVNTEIWLQLSNRLNNGRKTKYFK